MKMLLTVCTVLLFQLSFAQRPYWQQRVDYQIELDMDVSNYNFTGKQKLTFTNNSPDTIHQVFYHLYFNAFQPGSMMDVRSRTIEDADPRVADRISLLEPHEIGRLEPTAMKQDGKKLSWKVRETILQVQLKSPLLPGKSTVLDMDFEGQVPVQIRRTGRDSREGIALSMAQWYPKLCNYDQDGWHPNPYVGREFYGIWGDFDVKITIDKLYVLGGTGYLQNPNEVGYGYQDEGVDVDYTGKEKLTWHFKAPNVHDFVWAADPEYAHFSVDMEDGPTLHFLFKGHDSTMVHNWFNLAEYTMRTFEYANKRFGKYPYEQYSVIQGGDGGMEYPMATLITGRRRFGSLVGVTVHEVMHSWYQGVLATNEALFPWMDEGFTTYASELIMNELFPDEDKDPTQLHQRSYAGYFTIAGTEDEDPLITHADHYRTNRGYGISSYSKGQIYLHQLSYVVGQDVLDRSLLRFYHEWKFKHPNPNDFLRIVEKESGLVLDWYHEYFVNSTATIDYSIRAVEQEGSKTKITLERIGRMPMPVELMVKTRQGKEELHYVPMVMMHGSKKAEDGKAKRIEHPEWPWTNPTYTIELEMSVDQIESIEIDPSLRMADIDRSNNRVELTGDTRFLFYPNW
jgi:hypothetical protein